MTSPAGEAGEIAVSVEHVLSGYMNRCSDEQNKFTAAGLRWHRTGDAGYLDERGRLCLLGRCSARIQDSHGTLYPLSVEHATLQHECVRHAAVARLRREEFDRYRKETAAPDDRFDTYGMAYHRNLFRNHNAEATHTTDGMLQGIGCCPGVVTGSVKVLYNPADDVSLSGEVLVAERTDPGWVPLYPAVSGILIERGSILSHSAVVAREMGIPTIVGITGLVNTLSTGQKVKMDGRSGTVEIVSDPTDTQPNEKR